MVFIFRTVFRSLYKIASSMKRALTVKKKNFTEGFQKKSLDGWPNVKSSERAHEISKGTAERLRSTLCECFLSFRGMNNLIQTQCS